MCSNSYIIVNETNIITPKYQFYDIMDFYRRLLKLKTINMKIRQKHILLLLAVLSIQLISSQKTVSGTVTDENGQPLVGVSIVEKGSTNGTSTDVDGNYSLAVKDAHSELMFSYIGFTQVDIPVGSSSTMDITMVESAEALDEVVVTSLGFREQKDELGYASSTVTGNKISKSGETNVLNRLSGKSSGVRISRNSSDPGAGAYIQIRGVSSITRNSQPLISVDGVPIRNDVRGNSDSGGVNQESRLNDINPNDIETITVLKGASAAALWGTQALGGVVNITTKSGKFNSRLSVSLKSTYSYDVINRKYPFQDKFGQGDNGVYDQRARDSWGDKLSDRAGGLDDLDTSGEFYIDQDRNVYYPVLTKNSRERFHDSNFDKVFDNGHFLENNLSISGGNQKSSLFFSLGDLDQQGIIKNNSDYRRTTL